ncbi:MAG: hypothetical protein ACRDFX_07000 [Chloroflexota bacterium]
MFVVGLFIGPVIGVLAGDFLGRSSTRRWTGAAAIILFLLFVLFVPIFVLELKLGLIFGTLLGVLLAGTPLDILATRDSEASE